MPYTHIFHLVTCFIDFVSCFYKNLYIHTEQSAILNVVHVHCNNNQSMIHTCKQHASWMEANVIVICVLTK